MPTDQVRLWPAIAQRPGHRYRRSGRRAGGFDDDRQVLVANARAQHRSPIAVGHGYVIVVKASAVACGAALRIVRRRPDIWGAAMLKLHSATRRTAIAALLGFASSFAAELACDSEYECGLRSYRSLKGLQGVVFRIHAFGGLPKDGIATEGEANLRRAGLRLLTDDEWRGNPMAARLDLTLTLTCRDHSCGYTTRLALRQPARLIRNPSISSLATTWGDGFQNAIAESELGALPSLISVDARAVIKIFIDDYLKGVNQ